MWWTVIGLLVALALVIGLTADAFLSWQSRRHEATRRRARVRWQRQRQRQRPVYRIQQLTHAAFRQLLDEARRQP
jgi:Flp pilus assembly protein TadB